MNLQHAANQMMHATPFVTDPVLYWFTSSSIVGIMRDGEWLCSSMSLETPCAHATQGCMLMPAANCQLQCYKALMVRSRTYNQPDGQSDCSVLGQVCLDETTQTALRLLRILEAILSGKSSGRYTLMIW